MTKPVFTQQPLGQTIVVGQQFLLSAVVTGAASLQWMKNSKIAINQVYSNMGPWPAQLSDLGVYQLVATGSKGEITKSLAIAIIVQSAAPKPIAPTISVQPKGAALNAGGSLALSILAAGTAPLAYQWRLGGNPIGSNAPSYSKASVVPADAGSYDCVVSGPGGSITSQQAVVTVAQQAPATSPWVLAPGSSKTILDPAGASWAIDAAGNISSNGKFVVGASSGLTLYQGIIFRQDTLSRTWWTIINGIVVQSSIDPTKATPAPIWDPPTATTISVQPQGASLVVGAALSLSVVAAGTAPLAYQWRLNQTPIAGAQNTSLAKASVGLTDAGSYDCVVSGPGGSVTSQEAVITVSQVVPPPVGAIVMPKIDFAYNQNAHLINPGDNIQAALDQYKVCRLANTNYGAQNFAMKTGYQMYGLPYTDLGGSQVSWQPGTTQAVWSLIGNATITFPPGAALTQACILKRVSSTNIVLQKGCNVDSCIFAHINYSGIDADGIWTNNRFFFHKQQSNNTVMETLSSTPAGAATNNVAVGRTYQSAYGGGGIYNGLGYYSIAGFDCEDFKSKLLQSTGGQALIIFMPNGGTDPDYGASGISVANGDLQIIGGGIGGINQGIGGTPGRLLLVDNSLSNQAQTLTLLNFGTPTLSAAQQAALLSMLQPNRISAPWEQPNLPPIIDPLGSNWRQTIPAGHIDSTQMIAQGIAKNGLFMLAAGTYYVDAGNIPITDTQGVCGAGEGKTIIINTANNDTFVPNIASSQPNHGTAATGTIHLLDLTMYGGNGQLHFRTASDQPTNCVFSHIGFLYAKVGMWVDKIYGMDNNFYDRLSYLNCGNSFLQTPDPKYTTGETSTMAYVDKTMHYDCWVVNSPLGMQAARADNLDSFVNCMFQWSPSIFSGHNALTMVNTSLLNSPINAGGIGLVSVNAVGSPISGPIDAEGCSFDQPFAQGGYFMNCKSTARYGAPNGTLLNCIFADSSALAVAYAGGTQKILAAAAAKPVAQICSGTVMA